MAITVFDFEKYFSEPNGSQAIQTTAHAVEEWGILCIFLIYFFYLFFLNFI